MRRFVTLIVLALTTGACSNTGDGSATHVTASIPETSTVVDELEMAIPSDPTAPVFMAGWQRVATVTEEPWIDEINGAAALPGGGYVAATAWAPTVMWSPNGIEWFDGDPRGTIEARTVGVTVVGDEVVLLGSVDAGSDAPDGIELWIGDPTTATWEQMLLETDDLGFYSTGVSIASNEEAILFVADLESAPGDGDAVDPEVAVWLVDPAVMTSTRATLGIPSGREDLSPSITWFDGQWLMIVDIERADGEQGEPRYEHSLWRSSDGISWSEAEVSSQLRTHPHSVSITSGRTGILATGSCEWTGGCAFWFSPNGVDWDLVTDELATSGSGDIYSDTLGFILPPSHRITSDGSTVERLPVPQEDFFILAASGGELLGLDGWGPPEEWSLVDLWLYRPGGTWQWMEIEEPWLASMVDIAPLSGGGFVAAATNEWSIVWSPDGIEWRDADPQRTVTVPSEWFGSRANVLTAVGDRVVVLDSNLIGIKIGDLDTQSWDSIEFDTSDLTGDIGVLTVASNGNHVLAIGYEDDYGDVGSVECAGETPIPAIQDTQYLAWVIDPRTGEVQRHSISYNGDNPDPLARDRLCGASYGTAVWFKDRWVLNLDDLWFVSPDATTWTQVPVTGAAPGADPLTAGPDTLLAERWNALTYSEDGTDWDWAPELEAGMREPSDATAYSEVFGYIATPWSDPGLYVSNDGRHWQVATRAAPEVGEMVASGDRAFGIDHEFNTAYLFIYSELGATN